MRRIPTQAREQTKHATVFSFSLPQTSRPLFTRAMDPQKVEAARKTNAAREFMLRWSKCTRVPPVETFTKSNQVFDALHCSAEIHHATTQRWRKLYRTMRAKSSEINQDRPASLDI